MEITTNVCILFFSAAIVAKNVMASHNSVRLAEELIQEGSAEMS